nr:hypothetical protein [Tanacetum cinerariifolium]
MLDKTNYSSWASRMLLYIKGKEHGKLLVDSILNGPFQYRTIVELGNETTPATVRARTYTDLTDEEKIRESVDIKETNIVLQGLPQQNEAHEMKSVYQDKGIQPQVVANSLVVHQQPYQAPALKQSYQAPTIQQPSSTELDLGLVVPSFNPSDDPIANLNKLMAFISTTFGPCFPQTNNYLRTSSNPRNQVFIQDGIVTVQTVQGRQTPRPKNSAWFKEKMLLTEALESTAYLDPEQLAFLLDNGDTIILAQASQEIPTPTAFQTDDLDAFDSDCDDIPLRITQTSSSNKKTNKVEDQPRIAKSSLNNLNHVSKTVCNVNVKHSVLNANSKLICATCHECMFDAIHDLCVRDYLVDVNARVNSQSMKSKNAKSKNKRM